jgi:pantetheine-phosphate adenylyltransferase
MTAIYPGSFDPITFGHLDIIERVSGFSDKLIVAVLGNSLKSQLLTADERVELIRELTRKYKHIEICSFSGLLVDLARETGATMIIRGLRAVTDFEYEFQMALTNRELYGSMETFLIPASLPYLYLSSSIVKEVFSLGGNIDTMVPPEVKRVLVEKFK